MAAADSSSPRPPKTANPGSPVSQSSTFRGPNYEGRGLVNLVAELEARLTGSAAVGRLAPDLSAAIPAAASSIVLVLFDGLGDLQLDHPQAGPFRESRRGVLDCPFPSTTTVSMATVATGTTSATHGVTAHLSWLPQIGRVVNLLKWVDLTGAAVEYPTREFLPAPNLWERLVTSGVQAVTVQPQNFSETPLTAALYRGARFVGADTIDDFVSSTVAAAAIEGTFVFTYVPPVDFAAHVFGLNSPEYSEAMATAAAIWSGISSRLPANASLIGTADHGVPMVAEADKIVLRNDAYRPLDFWGDPRALMVRGSQRLIRRIAEETGAEMALPDQFIPWMGPGPRHRELIARLPDAILLAPAGKVILPPGFDRRLVGYHGGLTPEELSIPLLVGSGGDLAKSELAKNELAKNELAKTR